MPPTMPGWNLGLRFVLEVMALVGLGAAAWSLASDPVRWLAVVLVPAAAAAVWVVFNVLDDPSRSGAAPVEVAGWIRLTLELTILGGGALAVARVAGPPAGLTVAALVAFHYAASWDRVVWLSHA
ncbi:MAG: DUF2568 domain-containing protein [Actinomycetota bacterium]